jgi:hypothetical protein
MNNQMQYRNDNVEKNHVPQTKCRLLRAGSLLSGGIVGAGCANIIWICLCWKYELAATVMIPMIMFATIPLIVIQFSVVIGLFYLLKTKYRSDNTENT